MARTRVLIAGAAGRDFHNFNLVYRDRPAYDVVAFTRDGATHVFAKH